jgi:hypothetical protein
MPSVYQNASDGIRSNIYLANQLQTNLDGLMMLCECAVMAALGFVCLWFQKYAGQAGDPVDNLLGIGILCAMLSGCLSRAWLQIVLLVDVKKSYAVTGEMRSVVFSRVQHLFTARVIVIGLMWLIAAWVGVSFGWLYYGLMISVWILLTETIFVNYPYVHYFLRLF